MLELVTPPSGAIVTAAEAAVHFRQTYTDANETTYIESLIAVATTNAEAYCNRGFINQTWDLYLDSFPEEREISLQMGKIRSVIYVKYYDESETQITMSPLDYQVDMSKEPGRIALAAGLTLWPVTKVGRIGAVQIRFSVGYGADASFVPDGIKHAVKIEVASLYSNREDEVLGTQVNKLSRTSEVMLAPYRLIIFP